MGYCHRDSAEGRTDAGQLSLCVAIDRVGKFASAAWHEAASQVVAAQCLRNRIAAVPSKIHSGLTETGIQFPHRKRARDASQHLCERVRQE